MSHTGTEPLERIETMAEAAAKTTNPRSQRQRAAATTSTSKAAAKPAATKPAVASAPTADDGKRRFTVELEAAGETKSFAKFVPPKESGCVGQFYAPLGTETVKVLLIGPADGE